MAAFDWRDFLKHWSQAIITSEYVEDFDLPSDAVKAEWLGFDRASEEQIVAAEKRLGMTLPPSYREFLKTTNGWRHTGNYIERILPVEEIHWVRDTPFKEITETIDIWLSSMPDNLPPDEDGVDYRHLHDALVISAPTDEAEVYLLNAKVIASDGEWQAWAFAHWIPGIEAHPSFRELLQTEFRIITEANEQEAQRIPEDASPQDVATGLVAIIQKLEEQAAFYQAGAALPINAKTAAGLAEVLERLHALQSEDPATLREKLLALATEFHEKHTRIIQEQQKRYGLDNLMKSLSEIKSPEDAVNNPTVAQMMEFSMSTAKASGYAQAAGMIRYFVK